MKRSVLLVGFLAAGFVYSDDMTLKQAQEVLKSQGYYTGDVDGIYNSHTEKALMDYQQHMGLPATGKLDPKTTARMNDSITRAAGNDIVSASKNAATSVGSESRSAWQEVTSVFTGGKKKPTPVQATDKQPDK